MLLSVSDSSIMKALKGLDDDEIFSSQYRMTVALRNSSVIIPALSRNFPHIFSKSSFLCAINHV